MPLILYSPKKKVLSLLNSDFDPYWANVVLLMHMDEAVTKDEVGHSFSTTGSPSLNTSVYKFGSKSGYFSSGNYVYTPYSSDFTLNTLDFTVEAWVYPVNYGEILSSFNASSPYVGWLYGLNFNGVNGKQAFSLASSVSDSTTYYSNNIVPLNTWSHIAVVRKGTKLRFFLNGVLDGEYTITASAGNSNSPTYVGVDSNTSRIRPFTGYIDELRVTKGISRYESNFSVPTKAFPSGVYELEYDPYWEQTVLSIHGGNGDNYDKTFVDSSINTNTVTIVGDTKQGFKSPFTNTNTGSMYFDGSGDYIYVPKTGVADFGTSDFTIETWVYRTSSANYGGLLETRNVASSNPLVFGISEGSTLDLLIGTSTPIRITGSTVIPLNTWVHVAAVRQGNNFTVYYNGVSDGSLTYTGSVTGAGSNTYIGAIVEGVQFSGYMSSYRIVKGSAVYTGNFTVPTEPLTAVTGTTLLLNAENSGFSNNKTTADSSNNKNIVILNGNVAQGSFTPFIDKGGSAYFDGVGDYISVPDSADWALGNVFTIECWVWSSTGANSSGKYNSILGQRPAGDANSWYIHWGLDPTIGFVGPAFEIRSNSSSVLVSLATNNTAYRPTLNAWHHLAVTHDGSTIRLFQDGILVAEKAYTGGITDTNSPLTIGALLGTNEQFNGYMSNVRIVKGQALYTSNFNVPTEPLTATNETKLLLKFENAGIVDETKNNNIETVGNVSVTAVQKRFGNTSVYFDGSTTSFLRISNSYASPTGTEDFTIEFWVNPASIPSGYRMLVANTTTGGFGLNLYSDGKIGVGRVLVGTDGVTSSSLTFNTWNHIAASRISGILRIYINGVVAYSAVNTTSFPSGNLVFGIDGNLSSFPITAYFDDIRFIRGNARYTTNFVPKLKSQYSDIGTADYDPYWDKVSLYIPMNGEDNGTVFTDLKGNTITRSGNVVTKTGVKKLGTASAYFDGSSYLGTTLQAGFNSNNFTVEFYVYPTQFSAYSCMFDSRSVNTNATGFYIRQTSAADGNWEVNNGNNSLNLPSNTKLSLNNWQHIAFIKNNGSLYLFLNGKICGYKVLNQLYSDKSILIGSSVDGYRFQGYIDEVRITNGVARYVKNFVPSTKEHLSTDYYYVGTGEKYDPYWNKTTVLLPLSDLSDRKSNTVTQTGTVSISTTIKKFNGSATFGTVGNYLSIPYDKSKFDWWDSDFTLEMWIYPRSHKDTPYNRNQAVCIGNMSPTTQDNAWSFGTNRNGKVCFYYWNGDANSIVGVNNVLINEWSHIAITVSNGVVRLFLNGFIEKLAAISGTPSGSATWNLVIGQTYNTAFDGQIEDIRITKGKARYTTNFNVPTESLPTLPTTF